MHGCIGGGMHGCIGGGMHGCIVGGMHGCIGGGMLGWEETHFREKYVYGVSDDYQVLVGKNN